MGSTSQVIETTRGVHLGPQSKFDAWSCTTDPQSVLEVSPWDICVVWERSLIRSSGFVGSLSCTDFSVLLKIFNGELMLILRS